jgi:imidazolonepropionase-like amidohydrolase
MRLLRLPCVVGLLSGVSVVSPAAAFSGIAPAAVQVQAPAGPATPAGVIAFVDVAIVPMDGERVLPNQTVLVEGGRITALGPSSQVKVPAGAAAIDGRGKYLMPGLADMHVHLGNAQQPGAVTDAAEADATVKRYEWALLAFLANGVTTIRNLNGGPWHVRLREQIAAGAVLGPRFYTAGPPVTQRYLNSLVAGGGTVGEAAAKIVTEHQAVGYDFLKLWGEAAAIDREAFDTLAALAKQASVRLAGHTPLRGVGVERMLQAPAASIEHLSGYFNLIGGFPDSLRERNVEALLGRFPLDESKISELAAATARAGVWNCPTQYIYKFMFTRYYKGEAEKYLALRGRLLKALQDAEAGVLLGTDAADFNIMNWGVLPGTSAPEELQALVEAGLTPYQALAAGTRNPAAFLGTLDSTGTVEVGKRADLMLLHGNPLENIGNTKRPAGVMVGGRWLAREELDRRLAESKAALTATP